MFLPMMKTYIMNELLALFNQIRRLDIITPQGGSYHVGVKSAI